MRLGLLCCGIALLGCAVPSLAGGKDAGTIYQFTMNDIDGKPVKLSKYRGKVLLVVNVASKCGNTPQYAALEKLYTKYHKEGFEVLGFPENDFLHQEPGTNAQIKAFCTETYGVDFPMFSKIDVKGADEAPLYKWLIANSSRPNDDIEWNFAKFLIGRDGKVIARYAPTTKPDTSKVVGEIQEALSASRTS